MNDFINDLGTIILSLGLLAQMATPFALVGLVIWLII